jgi:hypothetical protein
MKKIFDSQQGILKLGVKRYISVPIIIFPILSPKLPTMFSDVSFQVPEVLKMMNSLSHILLPP